MKYLSFILIILSFFSCNVSYNVSTIDDVYYSTQIERQNNSQMTNYVDLNDRYLSMKSRGNRWNTFDNDFYYWNFPNRIGVMNYWDRQFFFNNSVFFNDPWLNNYFFFNDYLWYSNIYNRPFIHSPFIFNNNLFNYRQPNYWTPYRNQVVIKPQQPNIRTINRTSYSNQFNNYDFNRNFNNSPRQFNLRSYDNSNTRPSQNLAPMNNRTAPVRKFD